MPDDEFKQLFENYLAIEKHADEVMPYLFGIFENHFANHETMRKNDLIKWIDRAIARIK